MRFRTQQRGCIVLCSLGTRPVGTMILLAVLKKIMVECLPSFRVGSLPCKAMKQ
jgi:hypothetical protein